MSAASLSAKRPAITAAEMFEMQNKDLQILRIARKLVFRLCAPAHVRYGVTNFCGQPVDVLRIQGRVQKVQSTASECRRHLASDRKQPNGDQSVSHEGASRLPQAYA